MSANEHVVNGAAVNTGAGVIAQGAASLAASCVVAAALTYHWMAGGTPLSEGGVESVVVQQHVISEEQLHYAESLISDVAFVQKFGATDATAACSIYAFPAPVGGQQTLAGTATFDNTPSYVWKSYAAQSALATVVVTPDPFVRQFGEIPIVEGEPNTLSQFHAEESIQLNGETTWTFYSSVNLEGTGSLDFVNADIKVLNSPWIPFAGAVFEAETTSKFRVKLTFNAGTASVFAHAQDNFYAGTNFPSTAAAVATAKKRAFAKATIAAIGTQISTSVGAKRRGLVVLSAKATAASVDTTLKLNAGYVYAPTTAVFPASSSNIGHAAQMVTTASASLETTLFVWTQRLAAASMQAFASPSLMQGTIQGYDVTEFVRSPDTTLFTRTPETKEFIRVAT